MSIFLSILKVIGIILLILLAVVLGIFLLVLFFPITYRVEGKMADENYISGKASWLFSLIRIRFEARNKEIRVWLRIAGIRKNIIPKEEKPDVKAKEEPIEEPIEEPVIQVAQISENEPVRHNTNTTQTEEEPLPPKKKSLQKQSWIDKIKKIIFSIKKNFADIKNSLLDETNQNTVKKLWKELKRLLRYLGPRRGRVNLKYGAGDPALTGKITGALSVMPFLYKKGVSVIPDFVTDKPYVKGTFRINGHIQMFHFIGTAIRLYKDKNIKKIISKFK